MNEDSRVTINVPELGEGIEKATLVLWHVNLGNKIQKDDDMVEVVTDKATFNIPAGHSGVIEKIFANEGDEVKIGQALAVIDTSV